MVSSSVSLLSAAGRGGHNTSNNDDVQQQQHRQYQRLARHIEPHVSMYAIVYRDPNGTPDNEHDDWYSCITDHVPAQEFVSLVKNSAAMVDTGSINRIRARRAQKAAAAATANIVTSNTTSGSQQQPHTWSSFLRNFFTVLTNFGRSSTTQVQIQPTVVDERSYYTGCLTNTSGCKPLSANLPCVSHYDPLKDMHVYTLCAIDTCISFRVVKDINGNENVKAYANIISLIRSFYESQVRKPSSAADAQAIASDNDDCNSECEYTDSD